MRLSKFCSSLNQIFNRRTMVVPIYRGLHVIFVRGIPRLGYSSETSGLNCLSGVTCYSVRMYASKNRNKVYGGNNTFYIRDRKLGFTNANEQTPTDQELTKEGFRILQEGLPKFKQEMKEKFTEGINLHREHTNYEYFFQADNKESMKKWVVSTDADYHQGKSKASFVVSESNKALFQGVIRDDIPMDGKTERLGFCNLRSPLKVKSFERVVPYDWSKYTHLMMRIRGDGRNYMLNIHPDRIFDTNWLDVYQYPLYTRGGPYWQFVNIPFSNFIYTVIGQIQDQQTSIPLEKIRYFSINAQDYCGAFQLEIDYIALFYDENHDDISLYETYQKNPYDV